MEEKRKRAKRTQTLPVIGNGGEQGIGRLADDSLNGVALKLITDLQPELKEDFAEWFRDELVEYREHSEHLASSPTPREEAQLVRDAQRYLREIVQRLENLPPITECWIDEESFRRSRRFFHEDRLPQFVAMSDEINVLLEITGCRLERHPSKPGRVSESLRDGLLYRTADWLRKNSIAELKIAKASEIAGNILRSANIPVPASVVEIDRRISKYKNGLKAS